MKKNLFIIFSFCILIFTACGPGKTISNNSGNYGYDRQYARELIVTEAQMDSVCVADTLTESFRNWYSGAFVDYETNKAMEKRFYIRNGVDKLVIYILSPYDDERFKLIIRTEINED